MDETQHLSLFQAIFNESPDAMLIADDEGNYIEANPAACELFRVPKSELLRCNASNVAQSGCDYPRSWRSVLEQERFRGEIRLLRPDGTMRETELVVTANVLPHRHLLRMRDVSDAYAELRLRKQAEDALAQEREFISTLIQYLPIGIISTSEAGEILFVNPAFEKICGYSSQELVGQTPPYPYWDAADLELIYSAFKQVMSGERDYAELWFTRKNGERFLASLRPITMYDERGNFITHLATFEDITDRRFAEAQILRLNAELEQGVLERTEQLGLAIEELRQEIQERLQVQQERDRFFNLSRDMLIVANFDGYFTHLNPAWEQTLGFASQELMAQPFIAFVHPDDQAATQAEVEKLAAGIPVNDFENRYRCRDGSYKWLSWTAVPFLEERLIYGGARDVSDRKQAEAVLYRREQQFRALVENSPDIIARFDRQLRHLYVNPAVEVATGIPPQEFIGKTHWDLGIPEEKVTLWHEAIQSVFITGQEGSLETDFDTPNGVRFFQIRFVPEFNRDGTIGSLLATARDITELKLTEVALRESEERFRSIFEQAACGIVIGSLDGRLSQSNQTFCQLIGYTLEETRTLTYQEITHPDDFSAELEYIRQIEAGTRSSYSLEKRYICKDGSIVWVNLTVALVFSPSGEVKYSVCVVKDISDRKRAEEKLRQSEERFRNLVETTSDWVWEINEDGFYTYTSPKVSELLGYTIEELEGKTPFELMPDREAHRIANFYHQLFTTQEPFSCLETLRIHKDGYRVVMEASGVPIFDADGKCCGYRGISRDITERKQMEEALRESQQKYQTLFESLPIGISITDKAGNIIEANRASEQILGLSIAEQTGRRNDDPQWQLVCADGTPVPPSEFAWVRALTENTVIENFEAGIVKTEGEITWISVTAAPISLPGYGVAIAYTDISDRKRAEEVLQAQTERERLIGLITQRIRQSLNLNEILNTTVAEVRQLLQNERVLLFQLCEDGVGRVVVESVAPGFPVTANMEFPDEIFPEECYQYYCQGQPRVVPDISRDDFAPCLIEFLQELGVKSKLVIPIVRNCESLVLTSEIEASQMQASRLWGAIVAHDCTASRQWQQWEIELLTSLATQIAIAIQQSELYLQLEAQLTELQRTEAALQQAKQAAEVANCAKSEFLANMSHELRTPLNGILGYTQILKKDTNLTERQQNSLSIVQQCGEHLLTLIEDILDLSKIEVQKMELYPREFHFPTFLNGIADLFKMRAQQKDISFTYENFSVLPNGAIADKKRLQQVLSNLLSNAVKFTDRGEVRFSVGYVELETEEGRGGEGELGAPSGDKGARGLRRESLNSMSGKGTNYHPNTLLADFTNISSPARKIRFQVEDTGIGIESSKLAEIFLPFHQVSDRVHAVEGTGLGLAISQKLVQMMGSCIQVRSTLGEGSTFWFDLDLPCVSAWNEQNPESDRRIVGFRGDRRKVLIVDDHAVNRSFFREVLGDLGFEVLEAVDAQDCLNRVLAFEPDLILMDLLMPGLDGLETTRRLRQLPQLQDTIVIALSANLSRTIEQESLTAGCQEFLPKPVQNARLFDAIAMHLGLEWIYDDGLCNEDVEPNCDRPPLFPPPPSDLATLSEFARIGDIEGILHHAEELEKLDSNLVPFATHIRQLAKGFKLKQLREIIQQYLANPQ